jgi:dTDP-4-dehydrorhamnose reductase
MKILLTGKHGQVGFELNKKLSALYDVIAIGREDLDLNHPNDISAFIDKIKPNLIIHPAAYTAVDKAESESETAYQVNVVASQTLANKASELNIPIIYFSTDSLWQNQIGGGGGYQAAPKTYHPKSELGVWYSWTQLYKNDLKINPRKR